MFHICYLNTYTIYSIHIFTYIKTVAILQLWYWWWILNLTSWLVRAKSQQLATTRTTRSNGHPHRCNPSISQLFQWVERVGRRKCWIIFSMAVARIDRGKELEIAVSDSDVYCIFWGGRCSSDFKILCSSLHMLQHPKQERVTYRSYSLQPPKDFSGASCRSRRNLQCRVFFLYIAARAMVLSLQIHGAVGNGKIFPRVPQDQLKILIEQACLKITSRSW